MKKYQESYKTLVFKPKNEKEKQKIINHLIYVHEKYNVQEYEVIVDNLDTDDIRDLIKRIPFSIKYEVY